MIRSIDSNYGQSGKSRVDLTKKVNFQNTFQYKEAPGSGRSTADKESIQKSTNESEHDFY